MYYYYPSISEVYINNMGMKFVDEDCKEEKAIFLNAAKC